MAERKPAHTLGVQACSDPHLKPSPARLPEADWDLSFAGLHHATLALWHSAEHITHLPNVPRRVHSNRIHAALSSARRMANHDPSRWARSCEPMPSSSCTSIRALLKGDRLLAADLHLATPSGRASARPCAPSLPSRPRSFTTSGSLRTGRSSYGLHPLSSDSGPGRRPSTRGCAAHLITSFDGQLRASVSASLCGDLPDHSSTTGVSCGQRCLRHPKSADLGRARLTDEALSRLVSTFLPCSRRAEPGRPARRGTGWTRALVV